MYQVGDHVRITKAPVALRKQLLGLETTVQSISTRWSSRCVYILGYVEGVWAYDELELIQPPLEIHI